MLKRCGVNYGPTPLLQQTTLTACLPAIQVNKFQGTAADTEVITPFGHPRYYCV